MSDKKILVTGAGGALGFALVERLLHKGYQPLLHCFRSQERLQAFSCPVFTADFSQESETLSFVQRLEEELDSLEGVIHNVGIYKRCAPSQESYASLLEHMRVNVAAPIEITNRLLPLLCKKGGSVVMLGSAGLGRGSQTGCSYHCSKQALWGYTKSLAKELKDQNVRVNMVSPGMCESSSDESLYPDVKKIPASVIARHVVDLLEASYITGQNLEVAAGFLV